MVDRGIPFQVGQTVTVLTDDEFIFVGRIVACHVEFECKCCEEHHRKHEEEEEKNRACQTFLELNLDEDVVVEKHLGKYFIVFQEGQSVFIDFCQIIAIAPGSPPVMKKAPL